ncbi:hypothetical protein HOY34_03680 [Xinfangfangia sp. D13-10-4-6]|uniref:DUF6404 family protein n=1 Tax=Pseudogemmobacter hezensis TaxID=2737662 RepID=UPI001552B96A|nr:DUF6404 family protein [Pseudogemmobacter hezensis]NPD14299.1 hypothetical protein [Pseudogemmobacter hezensis]
MASPEHNEKLALALELGERLGISRAQMLPPFLRICNRIGLPVRPLHYMPTWLLLSFLAATLGFLFFGLWWALSLFDLEGHRKLGWVYRVGPASTAALGAFLGGALTVFIRIQSLSRDLPRWRDL